MKSAFPVIAIKLMLVAALAGPIAGPVAAQTAASDERSFIPTENGYPVRTYDTYAEFALDMLLNQMQGRGLDVSINPDQYIVGPGDQFGVFFISGDIGDIYGRIGHDGRLFIKSVGSIDLTGATLADAVDRIRDAIAKKFSGSGFSVELTDFRFTRVNIAGQVARPGLYYVPAIWRASEAIDLAGGLTSEAAPRRISLRGDSHEYPVDLVRFKAIGDDSSNPLMCEGQTLIVPGRRSTDQYIAVSGLVNKPGMFAAVSGDRLSDFIAYAGGAKGALDDMMLLVSSPDGKDSRRLDGSEKATLDFIPAPGDNISLIWKEGRERYGSVVIAGEVNRPGQYPIANKDYSLKNILAICGGVTAKGSADMIQIYRVMNQSDISGISDVAGAGGQYGDTGMEPANHREMVSLNPRRLLDFADLILNDGDSIYVPRTTGMISVTGAVASPGLVRFQPGKGVDYYLDQAGGLGFDADRARMVVYSAATSGGISADKAGELFDGETLFVPRKESRTKP